MASNPFNIYPSAAPVDKLQQREFPQATTGNGEKEFEEAMKLLKPKTLNDCFPIFEVSAANGYPPASLMLVLLHDGHLGFTTKKDPQKREYYFKRASAQKNFLNEIYQI